jgi:VanZ like family
MEASGVHLGEFAAFPWLLPGMAVTVAVSIALAGPVGRRLSARPGVAWTLLMSLGIILSVTLTPTREALDLGAVGTGTCDLTRIALPPLGALLTVNDTSLNVLLFFPLGVAIAFIPRPRPMVFAAVAAITLPFAIETTQLLVPWLQRTCESADVVDNLLGLGIGLGAGLLVASLLRRHGDPRT